MGVIGKIGMILKLSNKYMEIHYIFLFTLMYVWNFP